MTGPSKPRRIAILLYPGVQSLDVTGPLEVFSAACEALSARGALDPGYEVTTIARSPRPVRASSGLRLVPDGPLPGAGEQIDTLIVPGGRGPEHAVRDETLIRWLAHAPAVCRRGAPAFTRSSPLAPAGGLGARPAAPPPAPSPRRG